MCVGFQRDGLAQIAQGIVQRLIGQTVHQVQVEVIEPCLSRHARRTHGFVTVVDAAEGLKLFLLKALDTDRQPIDPQLAIGDKLLLLEGARIRLKGDFDVGGERDALFDALQQTPEGFGAEQARRPATEENRSQLTAIHRMQILIEIGQQRVDVFLLRQHRAGGVRVEIAIRAFAHTPRNVDVQRQGRQSWQRRPRRGRGAADNQRRRGRISGHFKPRRWRSRSIARARWLIWFLSAGLSSALDTSRSGTQNSGS